MDIIDFIRINDDEIELAVDNPSLRDGWVTSFRHVLTGLLISLAQNSPFLPTDLKRYYFK